MIELELSVYEAELIDLLQVIQGIDESKARKIIHGWCNDLGMKFITDQTKVSELSVGQKQRLAFIRAVSPEFTVLFGDESCSFNG